DDDRDGDSEGLRHRLRHDRWSVPDLDHRQRVLRPVLQPQRRRHRCRTRRASLRPRHTDPRLQRPPDATLGGAAMSSNTPQPIDVDAVQTKAKKPTQSSGPRKLTKAEQRAVDAKTRLTSPWASGIALLLAILWTVPTFGLFVTSWRDAGDIRRTGWWTALSNP